MTNDERDTLLNSINTKLEVVKNALPHYATIVDMERKENELHNRITRVYWVAAGVVSGCGFLSIIIGLILRMKG